MGWYRRQVRETDCKPGLKILWELKLETGSFRVRKDDVMDKCLHLGIEHVHTSRHAVAIMASNLTCLFIHLPKTHITNKKLF